jgi:hypothetical protein
MTMTFFPPHHGGNDDFEWDLDVTYDFESYIDVDFDTEVNYDSEIDLNVDVCVDVEIDGNSVSWSLDAQAIGDDGAVDAVVTAIATDDYVSLTMSGVAAAYRDAVSKR